MSTESLCVVGLVVTCFAIGYLASLASRLISGFERFSADETVRQGRLVSLLESIEKELSEPAAETLSEGRVIRLLESIDKQLSEVPAVDANVLRPGMYAPGESKDGLAPFLPVGELRSKLPGQR